MRASLKTIRCLAMTTALIAPNLALSHEATPPAADAEYSRNWGVPMINALPAYLKGYTGKGIIVAIVDTGLDVDHPEFAGRISDALRNFGKDNDLDDVGPTIGEDGEIAGHGTHVAGIIGAARDGKGMQGVAYQATILPLRAIGVEGRDDGEPANEAIRYAVEHGAQVLNGSYGSVTLPKMLPDPNNPGQWIKNPNHTELDYQPIWDSADALRDTYETLKYAAANDVVLVFAAGNDYEDQPTASAIPDSNGMMPLITPENTRKGLYKFIKNFGAEGFDVNNASTYDVLDPSDPSVKDLDFSDLSGSMIVVVAVGKNGSISSYSDRCGAAAEWCLAAPGGDEDAQIDDGIYSTWPTNGKAPYQNEQGTSMAAPHVAGAAAVVRSAFPYMNARQTIETILTTATEIGPEEIYGQGLLNLGAAIGGPMEFRYAGVFDVDTKGYTSLWSNAISGPGDLTKRGAGTLILGGQSTYTGPTTVLGGTLAIDGSIVSDVGVSGAGTLAGVGAVGSLTAAEGGAVAPGSVLDPARAVAVLTVNGDFAQQTGSTYQAGLASTSDLIDVAGGAAIDAGAHVELLRQGTASVDTRYTLLTAAGGVSGTYGGLTGTWVADTPFVDFELAYDPQNVFLDTERATTAFAEVGTTFNQRSAAAASEALGAGNPIHDNILFLTTPEARNAFDRLSGEIHASAKTMLMEDSRFLRDAATSRVRAAFGAVAAPATPVMAYGPDGLAFGEERALARESGGARMAAPGPAGAPATTERIAFWSQAFGSWGRSDGDGNAARLKRDAGGILIGADGPIADTWRLGVLAGYSRSSFDVDDRDSSGDADNYHVGLYGGRQWGALGLRFGAAYSWHDIETSRSVAFPFFADSVRSSYDARTAQVFGEAGYEFDRGRFAFEPFANLAYVNLRTDGFAEEGGAAALSGARDTMETTFTTLGLRSSTDFTVGSMKAAARGMLGWRHAFGDVTPTARHNFTGGDAFAIAGTPIAENAVVIEVGLDLNLSDTATLGLSYNGQIARDAHDHGIRAELAMRF